VARIATQQVTLEHETFGSSEDPPLLLVMGFGAQLIAWPRRLCERLADGGRFVISFDNRDCGLSSKLDGQVADLPAIVAAASAGDFRQARALAPYTLSEMRALLTPAPSDRAGYVVAAAESLIWRSRKYPDARHPWARRHPHRTQRRRAHRRADPACPSPADRGHGARPARTALAADLRCDPRTHRQ
jgi:hypothetical protein